MSRGDERGFVSVRNVVCRCAPYLKPEHRQSLRSASLVDCRAPPQFVCAAPAPIFSAGRNGVRTLHAAPLLRCMHHCLASDKLAEVSWMRRCAALLLGSSSRATHQQVRDASVPEPTTLDSEWRASPALCCSAPRLIWRGGKQAQTSDGRLLLTLRCLTARIASFLILYFN